MSMKVLMDQYLDYVGVGEAPLIYHKWTFFCCLSAAIGRKASFSMGHFQIFPNIYVMLMGDPGTRKSTAIKIGKGALERSGFKHFSGSSSSQERFLQDLEAAGIATLEECSQQFICADEFNNFLGEGNNKFISTLTELFDAGPSFDARLKQAKSAVIPNPIVTMLGGNTHQNFGTCFPPSIVNNGFLSRLILVWGQRSGVRIPFPPQLDIEKRDALVTLFEQIQDTQLGPLSITPQAAKAIEDIYYAWEDLPDGRFLTYSQRRQLHLQKLCVICAAAQGKLVIDYGDVLYSNTFLNEAERQFSKALGEFGKSKTSEEASIVMNVLYAAKGKPVPLSRIWSSVCTNLGKFEDLRTILHSLVAAERVDNLEGHFIARELPSARLPHIDNSLMEPPDEYQKLDIYLQRQRRAEASLQRERDSLDAGIDAASLPDVVSEGGLEGDGQEFF